MDAVVLTDLGRVRQHNEDAVTIVYNEKQIPLFVLADGMGGHRAGDVASGMTTQFFQDRFSRTAEFFHAQQGEIWVREAIEELNGQLFAYAAENETCAGMGTTIVVALPCLDQSLVIGHVGDSRAYLFDEKGLLQVTEDHSYVNELVKRGALSLEDAQFHPKKNVLMRALGTEQEVIVDVQTIGIDEKHYLLLCTDGLSGKLSEYEMTQILQEDLDIAEKAQQFIAHANEAGGEDNISVVLVDLTSLVIEGEK